MTFKVIFKVKQNHNWQKQAVFKCIFSVFRALFVDSRHPYRIKQMKLVKKKVWVVATLHFEFQGQNRTKTGRICFFSNNILTFEGNAC